MSALKIFIIVGIAFLLGAAGTAGFVWYLVQDTLSIDLVPADVRYQDMSTDQSEPTLDIAGEPSAVQETQSGSITETVPEEGIPLPTQSLTAGQKSVAKAIGVDLDTFVITSQMVHCVEEKIGTTRTTEIRDGATPTMLEVARIAGCI